MWGAARAWFRSGVHPAMQVCVRRNGEVILDRAIGHAAGTGPRDPEDAERIPATPETPFCVYSTSKAITAFVVHKMAEKGVLSIDDPVADYIPGYEANGKGKITIGHVLAHRAGVPNLPPEALDLAYIDDHDHLRAVLCAAKPIHSAGRAQAYHAVAGGFILGEVVFGATGKDIRERADRGVPRAARLPLDELRGRSRGHRRGGRQLHHRSSHGPAALQHPDQGTRPPARPPRRPDQRPPLPGRHRPGGEPGHERERALPLLRGDARGRRARRRPRDEARDGPRSARPSAPTSSSTSRSASRPASRTA